MIRRLRSALRPEIRAARYNTGEWVEGYSVFLNKVMGAEDSVECTPLRKAIMSNKRGRRRERDPKPNDAGKSEKTPAARSNADDAEIICYTCRKPGHKSPACPEKDKLKSKN